MSKEAQDVAFRAIAECTYDWETWIGPDGRTRWINSAVARITGWSSGDCVELEDYPMPLIHPDDRPRVKEALRSAAGGSAGNDLEFRVLHADGGQRWAAMSWQSLVMPSGERLGYRTSVREITARKRLEGQLRQALERAREAERARAAFMANVSHELRTPLNNIRGHLDRLVECPLSASVEPHVAIVAEQTQVLIRLVDDLLSLTTHEDARAPLAFRRIRPRAVLTQCVEAQRPAVDAAGLTLSFWTDIPSECEIDGDSDRIGHILRNLLDNATKYTDEGSIEVRARIETSTDPWAGLDDAEMSEFVVTVEDTGVGVDPQRIEDLRQPLVRGDNSMARRVYGAGLGLAIVDRLCKEMQGTLNIESRVLGGTRVEIRLPTRAPDVESPPAPAVGDLGGLRVLVVDDNATGRELTCHLLLNLGCDVDSCGHGRDALERASKRAFDVVLMDLHMPDLDGETTARLLRAQTSSGTLCPRIIALTADVFGAAEAPGRGFDGRLTKPVDREALRQLLLTRSASTADDLPRLEQLVDPRRLHELRSVRTIEGETFFSRFAPRVVVELRELSGAIEHAPPREGESLEELAHQMRTSANIVGASDLAREAGQLQELAAAGEEPWAVIASVARQARRVADALERML